MLSKVLFSKNKYGAPGEIRTLFHGLTGHNKPRHTHINQSVNGVLRHHTLVLLPQTGTKLEQIMGSDEINRLWRQAAGERKWITGMVERFAELIAAAEREACAKTVERARLHMDGSLGLTHETDFIATRITDFLADRIRTRGGK